MNDRLCFLDPPFDDSLATELTEERDRATAVALELFGGIGIRGAFDGSIDDLIETIRVSGKPDRDHKWMGVRAMSLEPAEIRTRGGRYEPVPVLTFATGDVMRWFAAGPGQPPSADHQR